MKQVIVIIFFFCFAMIANAQRSQQLYTYKQKQLADSLRLLFPDLYAQQNEGKVPPATPMLVLTLPNKGTFDSEAAQGKIYLMKPDNMRLLKPAETNASMPNALKEETTATPLLLKKP